MRLYELESGAIDNTQLIALSTFLKQQATEMGAKPELSLKSFELMAHHMGIPMSFTSLKNLITQPPLNNVIDKIDGDKIYFKNDEELGAMSTGQDMPDPEKKVDSMAKKAMKKHAK